MTTRSNRLGVLALALAAAAMLAACTLAFIGTEKPAGAAFPGQNGDIVFEGRGNFGSDIFSIKPDGTGLSQLTETEGFNEFNPSYSASGFRVVFDTDRDGNQEIYKMDAGGSDETRLTFDSEIFFTFDGEPAFSPAGGRIVFARTNEKGQNGTDRDIDIYTMSDGGGIGLPVGTPVGERVVHVDGISGEPSFSPDGSKIVFENRSNDGPGVYVVNQNGTGLRLLAEGHNPSWSPDGSLITFEFNQQIFVMSADGSNQRQITPENSDAMHLEPTFAPDCTRIAYVKNTFTPDPDGESGTLTRGIYTTDLAGGDEQQVIAGSERVADPDWQPLSSTDAVDCPQPPPPPSNPQISIADTTVNEGDSGASEASFTVTLSEASTNAVTVDYSTFDGTATQPEDYQQTANTLTFAANETTATVTVPVRGDTTDEPDESFSVLLSNPQHAEITDGEGSATIVDDDEAAPTDSASSEVAAGGTLSTATGDGTASSTDPVNTTVTSPVGGVVSIAETSTTQQAPSGFTFFGKQVNIEAPEATVENPLILKFVLDASLLPEGQDPNTIELFRNGTLAAECADTSGTASPDPCVSKREALASGDVAITVLSSHASAWNFAAPSYEFAGFYSPVDNLPTLNKAKAGSAIPVKFSLGADMGLNVFAKDQSGSYPRSGSIACDQGANADTIEQTVNAGSSSLSYDASSGRYTYVWKTDKKWQNSCRQLVLKFKDGTEHRANFQFTK